MSNIIIIAHNSAQYWQTVELRTEVLRKPLKLEFTTEQLNAENKDIHIAYFNDNHKIIGCLILSPYNINTLKMRQVAVHPNYQYQGIGTRLVAFSENWSKQQGLYFLFCHARDTAVPFYQKLNWKVVGEAFYEVNIAHYKMEKTL